MIMPCYTESQICYLLLHEIRRWCWRVFCDGDDRIWRSTGLTVKPTLFPLDASIADVSTKQRRSAI